MFQFPKQYDVIVVGGGHAGVEAALAASRLGCQTLLLTMNVDTIAQMSCNPAIGGLAKGHLVREIDALGGEMARATDMTGLQFRMLNTRKGPSVWALRAQCDKKAYQFYMKWVCERQPNLDLVQGQVMRLVVVDDEVRGVETDMAVRYSGQATIITTGTFLKGLLHVGDNRQAGGRLGEAAATGLTASLQAAGVELARLKTGTPPRLLKKSIDYTKTEPQPGDEPVPYFSHWIEELFHVEQGALGTPCEGRGPAGRGARYPAGSVLDRAGCQLPCHITYTTAETARLIRENLHLSPLYAGVIEGIGPRYCPSIEDKIVRFSDKERHQIFLEPEGIATDEVYVNGFSTSLPFQVQVALVRTIIGCERAEIMRPAYAVEYDFAFPTQLKPSLELKALGNLFLAGQINGTSGYEEAAAQGIIAGLNAGRKVRGQPPIVLSRDQAYIGVLIDDLVTKGTKEPYRMFTSMAEHRLLLRQDNADLRLGEVGFSTGLLSKNRYDRIVRKRARIEEELTRMKRQRSGSLTLEEMLRRPDMRYSDLPGANVDLEPEVVQQVEVEVKYRGYIERQHSEVARLRSMDSKRIPEGIDFNSIHGLSHESRQKLLAVRPATLGQASRISGVTPADISLLMVYLRRQATRRE